MKKYNLKPLYIFLAIFATAWIVKLATTPKEIEGTKYHFEKNGKYVNSWDEDNHRRGEESREEIEEIQKNTHEDSVAVYPGYNLD